MPKSCQISRVDIWPSTDKFKFEQKDTVRLTSIDHPQIEGAYISGLCAANFVFLV